MKHGVKVPENRSYIMDTAVQQNVQMYKEQNFLPPLKCLLAHKHC
jgi:hypothetical protein